MESLRRKVGELWEIEFRAVMAQVRWYAVSLWCHCRYHCHLPMCALDTRCSTPVLYSPSGVRNAFLHSLAVVFSPSRLKHELFLLALAARLLAKLPSAHFYPLLWKVGPSLPPVLVFPTNKKGAQILGIPTRQITSSSALPGSLYSASFSLLYLRSLCSWFYPSPPSILLYLVSSFSLEHVNFCVLMCTFWVESLPPSFPL